MTPTQEYLVEVARGLLLGSAIAVAIVAIGIFLRDRWSR